MDPDAGMVPVAAMRTVLLADRVWFPIGFYE